VASIDNKQLHRLRQSDEVITESYRVVLLLGFSSLLPCIHRHTIIITNKVKNNNDNHKNVYRAVIMTKSLQEFSWII